MFALALSGRFGLADRDAIATLLIVLPAIAFATLLRGGVCCWQKRV